MIYFAFVLSVIIFVSAAVAILRVYRKTGDIAAVVFIVTALFLAACVAIESACAIMGRI